MSGMHFYPTIELKIIVRTPEMSVLDHKKGKIAVFSALEDDFLIPAKNVETGLLHSFLQFQIHFRAHVL